MEQFLTNFSPKLLSGAAQLSEPQIPLSDISFWFLPRKSAFVEDFSDILTNNKFNKKFGAITPTPYLNSLIPNYLITLINTLLKNKSAAKVSGTDL